LISAGGPFFVFEEGFVGDAEMELGFGGAVTEIGPLLQDELKQFLGGFAIFFFEGEATEFDGRGSGDVAFSARFFEELVIETFGGGAVTEVFGGDLSGVEERFSGEP
jgi:hypothetical protein